MTEEQQPSKPDEDLLHISGTGLNPFEILALPSSQRRIVTWMMRQQTFVTLKAVADYLRQDESAARLIIDELIQQEYIQQSEVEGQTCFQIKLISNKRSPRTSQVADMWKELDQ
jgi:hypothetical protein